MAEKITGDRTYGEIIKELFFGRHSALDNYAKVRHAKYEICLYLDGLPINYLGRNSISYFEKECLGGRIAKATDEQMKEGIKELSYRVGSCSKRCLRLFNELNQAIQKEGLGKPLNVQQYIDFFTFAHGEATQCKPYFIEAYQDFYDEENRRDFKAAVTFLKTIHRKMHPGVIIDLIRKTKRASKSE